MWVMVLKTGRKVKIMYRELLLQILDLMLQVYHTKILFSFVSVV